MAIQAQLYSDNLGFPLGGGNLSQEWMMENACGFNDLCFLNLQQQQQKQQQFLQLQQQERFQQQRNQDLCCENTNQPMSIVSQSIATQMEKQKQEIDRFITLHNERLRLVVQEHKRRQLLTILKKYESKSEILLRQKDEEIVKAANRMMELEDFVRKAEMERQRWERVAKENETMVINLNNTIEQLRENHCFSMNDGVEDAESCCQTGEGNHEEEEERRRMICKSCGSADSCVVFLPCRHMCSCKSCDASLDSCPVCRMVKKASIEVLI